MFYYQLHSWMETHRGIDIFTGFNGTTLLFWLASDLEPIDLKRYSQQ
jgi:hypothetical protein